MRGVAAPTVLVTLGGVQAARAGRLIDVAVVVGRRLVVPRRGSTVATMARLAARRRVATMLAHV